MSTTPDHPEGKVFERLVAHDLKQRRAATGRCDQSLEADSRYAVAAYIGEMEARGGMSALCLFAKQEREGGNPEAAIPTPTALLPEPSSEELEFHEGFARSIYVSAWANEEEAQGRHLRGELMDQAPKTSEEAKYAAAKAIGAMRVANGLPVDQIIARAREADGVENIDPRAMGHCFGQMAIGSGVSWFDDHERFKVKVPYMEFYVDGPEIPLDPSKVPQPDMADELRP